MKSLFIGGKDGDNRCINMYPEVTREGSKEPARMVVCPGMKSWLNSGVTGEGRGCRACSDGNLYAVIGNKVIKISTGLVKTVIGTILTSTGAIYIADNSFQMAFADGQKGYYYTYSTGVFSEITDEDFPNGTAKIEYANNYGICIVPDTEEIVISGITALHGDFSLWDALDFTSASTSPDRATSVIADDQVLVFGPESGEAFYYDGNADFPFNKVQGAPIKQGIIAPDSLNRFDNSIAWLGGGEAGQGIVWRLGDTIERISNHAVEKTIASWGTLELVRAFSFQQRGHYFYVLFHPTVGVAQIYDAATKVWHERAGLVDGEWTSWPAFAHAAFVNKNLVLHKSNGVIYELDFATNDYGGVTKKCLRQWRGPNTEGQKLTLPRMIIDCTTGVGITGGGDPQLMVRWSEDQGRTWGEEETVGLGRIGETDIDLPTITRLGTQRDWTFEISFTDAVSEEVIFNGVSF